MEQYIKKSDIVAEIKRLREEEYPCDTFEESTGYYNALDEVSYFLNTLEVKEINSTDAFIEKVENFLEMLGYGFTITDNITHADYDKEQLIEDFKEYLKEE